jgi:opacity protein-like surface antigen
MHHKKIIFILCLIMPHSYILAQQEDQQTTFSLSVAGAIPFSSPTRYNFLQGGISAKVPPGLFGSVGLVYEPIALRIISPTKVSLSAELSICNLKSEEPSNLNYHTQMKMQKVSAMVWTKLFIPTMFSPFVRAGIGVSRVDFQETYSISSYENVNANELSMALGLGGGVDLSISERFALSIFGDALFMPQDIQISHKDGTSWATLYSGATPMLGLRITIKL